MGSSFLPLKGIFVSEFIDKNCEKLNIWMVLSTYQETLERCNRSVNLERNFMHKTSCKFYPLVHLLKCTVKKLMLKKLRKIQLFLSILSEFWCGVVSFVIHQFGKRFMHEI